MVAASSLYFSVVELMFFRSAWIYQTFEQSFSQLFSLVVCFYVLFEFCFYAPWMMRIMWKHNTIYKQDVHLHLFILLQIYTHAHTHCTTLTDHPEANCLLERAVQQCILGVALKRAMRKMHLPGERSSTDYLLLLTFSNSTMACVICKQTSGLRAWLYSQTLLCLMGHVTSSLSNPVWHNIKGLLGLDSKTERKNKPMNLSERQLNTKHS